jgi:hypothetical protein
LYKFRSSRIPARFEAKLDAQASEDFLTAAEENLDLPETPKEIQVEPLDQTPEAVRNQKLSAAQNCLPSETKDEYHDEFVRDASQRRRGSKKRGGRIVEESFLRRNKPREM